MQRKPYFEIVLVVLGTLLYFLANIHRVAVPGAIFDELLFDIQSSAQAITALGSIYMYSYAFGQLIVGVLVARYGGFRVVTFGAVLFFIGSLLFSYSVALPLLFISRLLIGLGSASFYLGLINELRKLVSHKNFGVILSLILLIGYTGGIVANAPLVLCVHKLGWKDTFFIAGAFAAVVSVLFCIICKTVKPDKTDTSVRLNFDLFKLTFTNKKNIYLYSFACLNYGLYYVIQTVIGKKFLEDFCNFTSLKAAVVMSVMALLYAVAGSLIAFFSKISLNKRTIFLKLSGICSLIVFGFILLSVCLNIQSPLICFGFCVIAFGASLSPILIPLLHDYNDVRVASTAVSVMTCGFFVVVAVLGGIIGVCLDNFSSQGLSYVAIFTVLFIVSLVSIYNVFKVEESKKTLRYIEHIHYMKEHGLIENN